VECSLSSLVCHSSNSESPELEAKPVLKEASPHKDSMETKVHKVQLLVTRAEQIRQLPIRIPPPPELRQLPAFLQACQAPSPMQIPPSTTELSTRLLLNTNFMQWVDINNKELATTTDTLVISSSEVQSRVDLDTLK
jgi:hypothetical protein